MKTVALIPARKGSKGIPGKNFKIFNGKELWKWSEEIAKQSGIFDHIIISTDDDRPPGLCADTATIDELLIYYAQHIYPDVELWCILQPTSPLRTAEDIKSARSMLNGSDKYDSVVSVYNHPVLAWVANSVYHKGRKYHTALYHTHKRPNRQDRKEWYLENGAVYFTTIEALKKTGSRIGESPALYVMPKERSFEIDDEFDWKLCEWLARNHDTA